jgi:GNAT superfamily N-acetyltransferase
MAIEIIRCDAEHTRDLARAYNEAIRFVPHSHPVRTRYFGAALAPAMGGDPDPCRSSEAVLAVRDRDELLGFAHVALGKPELVSDDAANSEPEAGLLRFFWYRPGRRQAGKALLEAAEAYYRERRVGTAVAFLHQHNYPFYHLPPARLSDRLGHIGALLGIHGYEPVTGGVFMDWRNFAVTAPSPDALPVCYSIEHVPRDRQRPQIEVRAFLDGKQIGICQSFSAAERSHARPAQAWLFTEWLGVENAYQGRGLGRSLLQRTLVEGRKLGYRHAVISTGWRNYRACTFFTNFGYRVSDWTYGMARALT